MGKDIFEIILRRFLLAHQSAKMSQQVSPLKNIYQTICISKNIGQIKKLIRQMCTDKRYLARAKLLILGKKKVLEKNFF